LEAGRADTGNEGPGSNTASLFLTMQQRIGTGLREVKGGENEECHLTSVTPLPVQVGSLTAQQWLRDNHFLFYIRGIFFSPCREISVELAGNPRVSRILTWKSVFRRASQSVNRTSPAENRCEISDYWLGNINPIMSDSNL